MATSVINDTKNYKVFYGSKIFVDISGNQDTSFEFDDQFPSGAHPAMLVPIGYSVSASWANTVIFKEAITAENGSPVGFRVRINGSTTQTYTVRYWLLYY